MRLREDIEKDSYNQSARDCLKVELLLDIRDLLKELLERNY